MHMKEKQTKINVFYQLFVTFHCVTLNFLCRSCKAFSEYLQYSETFVLMKKIFSFKERAKTIYSLVFLFTRRLIPTVCSL